MSFVRECGTNTKYIVTFPLQQCHDTYIRVYIHIYTTFPILLLNKYRVFLTISFSVTARVTQDYEPVSPWILVNACSTPSNITDWKCPSSCIKYVMRNTVVCKGYRGAEVLYTQNFYYSNIYLYHVCFSFLVAFKLVKEYF